MQTENATTQQLFKKTAKNFNKVEIHCDCCNRFRAGYTDGTSAALEAFRVAHLAACAAQ